jgi:hypothetical protein
MAWTSGLLTQNGNTTVTWTTTGSPLSTHDCVVVGLISGNSILRLERVDTALSPTRYGSRVTVVGSQAVAFRLYAEKMD